MRETIPFKTEGLQTDNAQVIFVTASGWNASTGTLAYYERKSSGRWKMIDSFPVMLGRNGLAWDYNSPMTKFFSQKMKHEGDGCSPAGVFALGPVFSYHEMHCKMPSVRVDANDICVDDMQSPDYNLLVRMDTLQTQPASFEKMHRDDGLYEYGIWVQYNSSPVTPGNGSCIFLHIWKDDGTPTSGCTAMSREHILRIIGWLDPAKHPVLIQYAKSE